MYDECLQPTAISQRQAYNLREAFKNLSIGRDLEFNVLDMSSTALMKVFESVNGSANIDVEDVFAVENVARFFIYLLTSAE